MSGASTDQRSTDSRPAAAGDTLLRTKLFLPSTRTRQVARPRLIEKLNGGLDKALILVSAPAGYGKTTLVSSWLRESGIPAAWLSLDEEDNEPRRFLEYLVAALRGVVPAIPGDAVKMLQGTSPSAVEALLTVLINEISLHADPLVLVLDDLHQVHARPVLDALGFLLDHVPPNLHLVLLSRSDLPLPLGRLRARAQLLDVRAEHMRFAPAEVATFLRDVMDLRLSPDEIAIIEARTEGWVAGLQLAALSLKGSKDAHGFVEQFAGRQDYIVDYLVEEVLNVQPPQVSAFLLQTSGLDRMCGALCEAVVEPLALQARPAQAMLEALDQMNLFIMPLDEERQWYRYHHLFADVLHKQLRGSDPDLARQLERRAAQWYEANACIPEAIHHSIAAGEMQAAIRLVEQNGCTLLIRGEVLTLGRWLDSIEASARDRPWLPIYRGWIAALTGDADRADAHLRRAEELIAAQPAEADTGSMQGALAAARAHVANLQGRAPAAAAFARQALSNLTAADDTSCSLRVVARSLLGDASALNGELDVAWEAYNEAASFIKAVGDVHLTIILNSNLANILAEKGQLRRAAAIHRETLGFSALPGGRTAAIGGRALIELSQICYEWNELAETAELLERGLALCKPWGNRDQEAAGLVVRARLMFIEGDEAGRRASMQTADRLVRDYRLAPATANWINAGLAQLWIAAGESAEVVDRLSGHGLTDESEIPYLRELEFITRARLLLAQGKHEAALQLTRRLLAQVESGGRGGRIIEILVLQAMALQAMQQTDQALLCLGRALALGRPEGYVRTFLDEGERLTRLLYLAKTRETEGAYATKLLALLRRGGEEPLPASQLLPQPLTARELEVLQLIDGGCSNHEIAAQLYISPATVKRHISNIYTKLDARGRTQALARSRELRLLE